MMPNGPNGTDAHDGEWGHWPFTGRRDAADLRIIQAKFDTFTHPVTGRPLEATVLEGNPWCNIVAITPDERLVMVRQFRFGVREVTLEIPGGLVDPGEGHGQTARRELGEETGYTSDSWTYLGDIYQNPGLQNELCHLWLATNAQVTGEPAQHDSTEHIAVDLMSKDNVRAAVFDGRIRHPHALVALSRVLDLRVQT